MTTQEFLYLEYHQSTDSNVEHYSDEPYDYSWSSETTFSPKGLWTKPGAWYEEIAVDVPASELIGKQVALVIVRYSTGDTFGHGRGKWAIAGVFPNPNEDEVEEFIRDVEEEALVYNSDSRRWQKEYGGVYKAWIGYFEHLEDVSAVYLTVQDGVCPSSEYC